MEVVIVFFSIVTYPNETAFGMRKSIWAWISFLGIDCISGCWSLINKWRQIKIYSQLWRTFSHKESTCCYVSVCLSVISLWDMMIKNMVQLLTTLTQASFSLWISSGFCRILHRGTAHRPRMLWPSGVRAIVPNFSLSGITLNISSPSCSVFCDWILP